MTVILHIGGSKTGSTSIQTALVWHIRALKRYGLRLPKKTIRSGDGKKVKINFRSLFHSVHQGGIPRGDRNRFSGQKCYKEYQEAQSEVLQAFLRAQAQRLRHVVISDEYLFGFDYESVERLASYLTAYGHGDVRVIVYLRDPVSLFLSMAQQRLKADHRLANPYVWHYPYGRYLDPWFKIFPGAVEVRLFQRADLVGGSVVSDFAACVERILNLQVNELSVLDSGTEANQSLSAEGMALLYQYQRTFHRQDAGRFTPDGKCLLGALINAGQKLELERPILRTEIKDAILQRHCHELLSMAEAYNLYFESVDYGDLRSRVDLGAAGVVHPEELSVHDLLCNLDSGLADLFKLQCIKELSSRADS